MSILGSLGKGIGKYGPEGVKFVRRQWDSPIGNPFEGAAPHASHGIGKRGKLGIGAMTGLAGVGAAQGFSGLGNIFRDSLEGVLDYELPGSDVSIGQMPGLSGLGARWISNSLNEDDNDKIHDGLIGSISDKYGFNGEPAEDPVQGPVNLGGGESGTFLDAGDAPTFDKTLTDYMNDPALINIVNSQIIGANSAIGRENRDLRKNMMRDMRANTLAGQNVQDQAGQIIRENNAGEAAIASAAADRSAQIVDDANEAALTAGAGSVNSDYQRAQLQGQAAQNGQDIAAGQKADADLLAELAAMGGDTLSELKMSEALDTQATGRGIRNDYMDEINTNRGEAAANWGAPKQEAMLELAQNQFSNALQEHQLGLQAWQTKFNAQQEWAQQQAQIKSNEAVAGMQSQGGSMMDAADINARFGHLFETVGKVTGTNDEGLATEQEMLYFETLPPEMQERIRQEYEQYTGQVFPAVGAQKVKPVKQEGFWGKLGL